MGLHHPFRYLKHKLWPKERSGIKLTIWLLVTKCHESPQFPCVQVGWDILLESSWRGLQLCFKPHFNRRSIDKVMGPQSCGVPTLRILGLPLGSPRTKCHLDVSLMERHKVYYKREGGGFPQVRAVVSFVSPSLPVARPSTKSAPAMH
jgi:hypothetical protein